MERLGPVNYKIRHQLTGASKNVHVKDIKRVDPSGCWDRQYNKYSELTAHKPDPEIPPTRQMPPRLAKLSAPLSDPNANPKPSPNIDNEDKIPPLLLHRTVDGWQIGEKLEEDMDVSCIYLYSLASELVF